MATKEEVREAYELIKKVIPGKNRYDRPLWQGVVDLIEKSEFGTKNADIEVKSPLPSGRSPLDEIIDGGFDDVQMEMLHINCMVLGGHGNVGIVPYSKGLGTRSMTFTFRVKK